MQLTGRTAALPPTTSRLGHHYRKRQQRRVAHGVAAAPSATASQGRHAFMGTSQRDDVVINFQTAGSGGPPLVFVHGWCSDHRFFQPQFEHFQDAHHVVAIDLRGHGASSKPPGDYDIPTYAADLAWLCEELNLTRPIVIGHSMGALVALEAAYQFPTLMAAAVLIEPAPLAFPSDVQAAMPELLGALAGPHHKEAQREFIEGSGMFMPTDDADQRAWIVDAMTSVRQDVMLSSLMAIAKWGAEATQKHWTLPVLDIIGANPLTDPALLRALCSDLKVEPSGDVGHFNQLLAPQQVNDALEKFLVPHSQAATHIADELAAQQPRQ